MADTMNRPTTYTTDLFIPEVIGNEIQAKLTDLIKFSPYAEIDTTLVGVAGDEVTLPVYTYIGDAEDVEEGAAIPFSKLTQTTKKVKIKKAGRGTDITDESLLIAFGDPLGESIKQLALAIASKVDNDVILTLKAIGPKMTVDFSNKVINADSIADGLVKFGEEVEGTNIMFIAPEQLATIRKSEDWIPASEMNAELRLSGAVGQIFNTQFVISNKVKADANGVYENFLIRKGALKIYLKRDVVVETDRDIVHKTTLITADKLYVTNLADESKAIKFKFKKETATISL